jgi:hypothetical protein
MRTKLSLLTSILVLASIFLSSCGGNAPASDTAAVQTIAATTLQAMTQQVTNTALPSNATSTPVSATTAQATAPQVTGTPPSIATSTPAPIVFPTAVSAQVYPRGSFVPYSSLECERLRSAFEEAIGAPVVIETVPFNDRVSGGTGTACRIHGTGTGATYTMPGPFNTLVSLVPTLGWTEDGINYGAGGPTGMSTGYHKGGALGLLSVGWHPSADANCPKDQPIGMCALTPEQKIFDVTFDVADLVVYNPPIASDCASALALLQPAIPVPLVLETVDFTDFEMNRGTACQVRGQGNGNNFANIGDTAQAIDALLTPLRWTLVNGADGPTGTGREYTLGNLVAVVFVKWEPSADANCPQNQPIGMCVLTPEQKLYTVTIAFAEK